MTDKLEELAKKGRAADKAADEVDSRGSDLNDDFRRYLSERLVIKTFSQVHASRWIVPTFFGVIIAVAGTAAMFLSSEQMTMVFMSIIGVGLVGGFILMRLAEGTAVRAGTKWIAALPFTFQSARYLEALSKSRSTSTMTVRIKFKEPPSRDDRETFGHACAGAVEVAERGWKDDVLWVRTAGLATYFSGGNNRESYYSNAQLHLWFRTLVDDVLRPVHARAPIARVKVKVE